MLLIYLNFMAGAQHVKNQSMHNALNLSINRLINGLIN